MNKNILFTLAVTAMILPLQACSSSLFGGTKTASAPVVVGGPGASTEHKAVATTETASHSNQKQNAVSQSHSDNTIAETPAYFAGEWVIESVGDTRIVREEDYPYITFVPSDDSFFASNGCNILNGSFTVGKNNVTFHNVLATMKYCADTPFDTQINQVIADEKPWIYKYEVVNGEPFLYLSDAQGKRVMTLHKAGLDFLNGNWQVTDIRGEKFDNSEMSIFFDVEARKVHGSTGCNSFNGEIFVDPQNVRTLSLTNMAVTMRMCPNIAQQSKFLVGLEETTGARLNGDGTVSLVNADGQSVMILQKK